MKRSACLVIWLAASCPIVAMAQQAAEKPPEPPKPIERVLSPAAAPVPVLRYRLLPSAAELVPGDAAPIYLRIHGYEDSSMEPLWRKIGEMAPKWHEVPIDRLPVAEMHRLVDPWSRKLQQLEYGTRRKTCDWNYTLPEERSHAVEILLPDAQSMRQWGRLLGIKARMEMAEGKLDEAIHTIGMGLAFARHVGDGPFVINGLVGIALAVAMLDAADELVGRPGSPNLYWALTALPRPFIDLRDQSELEQKMLEYVIPEFSEAEAARPREAAEWGPYLARMHSGIVRWYREFGMESRDLSWLKALPSWTLTQMKAESLPAARAYLRSARGLDDRQMATMPDDQLVALYLVGRYRELNDEAFKAAYLPPRDAIRQAAAGEERLKSYEAGPLVPALINLRVARSTHQATLRADRYIAILRVIEAIRMHAASHDGRLPESLDQITEVPVPDDPATGKPFLFRRSGDAAILHGPQAGLRGPAPTYRLTIRH